MIFLYILKAFLTMLHLNILLEYYKFVYLQNIVVCNEAFSFRCKFYKKKEAYHLKLADISLKVIKIRPFAV